jgi:hypothetical protein
MKKVVGLCISLWIAGCAQLPGRMTPEVEQISNQPGVGHVFGTLTQTFVPKARSRVFDDSYITHLCLDCELAGASPLRVKVVGGENNDVNPHFPGENGTLFVFEVPAGTHQIDRWYAREASKTILPEGDMQPLRFQVGAGEIVYIGNMHMRLTFGQNLLGAPVTTHVTPAVRDTFARDRQLLVARFPQVELQRVRPLAVPTGEWPTR